MRAVARRGVRRARIAGPPAAHRRPPYHRADHRTVAALPGEVTAVHAIAPGPERFMLVTDGDLVLPGPRGRRLCRAMARDGG